MYIEDQEFREIYQSVTPERLKKLEASLLFLEKNPEDSSSLEEFLREAHTLKGDSRMLGVGEVETLIHQMEDTMIQVKEKKITLTSQVCDGLHHGLDAVNLLVKEAVTGASSGVDLFTVLAKLMATAESSFTLESEGDDLLEIEEDLFPDHNDFIDSSEHEEEDLFPDHDLVAQLTSPTEEQSSSAEKTIVPPVEVTAKRTIEESDSIRVKTEDLDDLARQASELMITQLRINRRTEDINQLLNRWEELYENMTRQGDILKKMDAENPGQNRSKLANNYHDSLAKIEQLGSLIAELRNLAYEDNTNLTSLANGIESGVKTLRLLPLSNIFNPLQRLVRDLSKEQGKQIDLIIEGGDTKVDKRIIDEMKDPLLHIVRNAIDHGIETVSERETLGKSPTATIHLTGYQTSGSVGITIRDDGQGLNLAQIKKTAIRRQVVSEGQLNLMSVAEIQNLIFAPGFSTRTQVSEISGRGVGLDVVKTNVERLKGNINIDSSSGVGCEFRIRLSTSLGTTEALLLQVNNAVYALPVEMVETMKLIPVEEIFSLKETQAINIDDRSVSVVWLSDILNLSPETPSSTIGLTEKSKAISCVVLRSGLDSLGILVDAIIDQQDIVLKPQSKLIQRVRNIIGATILGSGEISMVLNAQDLIDSIKGPSSAPMMPEELVKDNVNPRLLLVEDSIIIRTQMKRILESAGYQVTIAVDGLEGWQTLQKGNFDVVISDVEMPNMNGFELVETIRQDSQYTQLPIVLVTTLAKEKDRLRGLEVGANAYLTKGDFDQQLLISTLNTLINN